MVLGYESPRTFLCLANVTTSIGLTIVKGGSPFQVRGIRTPISCDVPGLLKTTGDEIIYITWSLMRSVENRFTFIDFSVHSSMPYVRLKFSAFSTECLWDYLHVFNGDSIYGEKVAALS